ncbi:hypothetical protein CVIRNUC_003650 [Coccomyxa viridis]|uniref:Endonuclease/exonuclease/phosphatase domain-containing protein n=1 Tax=Coccomyxa viridis TaxID=1274662 RepID=A0AAV1I1W0_9CHLO|nr:hypothetical protein CVIRNUC_003650 [Coccomyxa viridis]
MPCIQTISDAEIKRLERAGINIVWYDDLEGDKPNVQTDDLLVKRIVKQYRPAETDIYDVLRARHKALTKSPRCVMIKRQQGAVTLPAGMHIYKGMDFFYTPAQESDYRKRVPDSPTWYGAAETAFRYVKRLGGALHSYISERDIALLEFTPENVRWCMRQLHGRDEGKAAELLDDMLCPENDPLRCTKKYLRRRRWGNCVWLRRAERPDTLGALRGQTGYDGYYYPEYLDPLTATGLQLEQVILLRPGQVLRRDIKDPLDWMRWPKSWLKNVPGIGDKAFQPNSDFLYGFHRNVNFRMVRFFFDHPILSEHNRNAECDADVDDFAELCRKRKWRVHRSPKQYGLMLLVRPWHGTLLKESPDVICGDLNMEPWTPEFKTLTDACTVPDLENSVTTPYGSRVDYIAYLKGGRGRADACYVLDSPFSDHLPVVHAVRAM